MLETVDASSYPAKVNGNPKPTVGSATAAQSVNLPFGSLLSPGYWLGPGTMLLGPGGNYLNPLNFPGWRGFYPGLTWVYDWMLRHPRIQQARATLMGPIIQSTWNFECDEKDDDAKKYRDAIKNNWEYLRPTFIADALRGLDYGCAKFEPVWTNDGGWFIEQMKPLDVDRAGVWADHGGTFTGFSVALRTDLDDAQKKYLGEFAQGNTNVQGPTLPAYNGKAWIYTHDKRNGYLHGRSILENLRETAWIPWLTVAQQLVLLGGKISGRQAYATVPAGQYTDPTSGQMRTHRQDAQDALQGWLEGQSPVFTSLVLEAMDKDGKIDPELKIKLLTETLVKFNVVDFGNLGPAIDAKTKELDKYEDLMFAGYLLSARTGMESQHGSRADSEQHTETGSTVSQTIGNAIAEQLQPLIDYQCKINWGVPARTVRIKQAPLRDTSVDTATKQIQALCAGNKDVAMAIAQKTNIDQLLVTARMPVNENVKVNDLLAASIVAQQQQQQAKPQGEDSPLVQMSRLVDAISEAA